MATTCEMKLEQEQGSCSSNSRSNDWNHPASQMENGGVKSENAVSQCETVKAHEFAEVILSSSCNHESSISDHPARSETELKCETTKVKELLSPLCNSFNSPAATDHIAKSEAESKVDADSVKINSCESVRNLASAVNNSNSFTSICTVKSKMKSKLKSRDCTENLTLASTDHTASASSINCYGKKSKTGSDCKIADTMSVKNFSSAPYDSNSSTGVNLLQDVNKELWKTKSNKFTDNLATVTYDHEISTKDDWEQDMKNEPDSEDTVMDEPLSDMLTPEGLDEIAHSDDEITDSEELMQVAEEGEDFEAGTAESGEIVVPWVRGGINKCPVCKRIFSKLSNLKEHVQRVHVNERKHRCAQCMKAFSVKSYLNRHMRRVHSDEKIFHCGECDFTSSYFQGLESHISSVHRLEQQHKCCLCGEGFSHNSALSSHLRTVHNHGELHECPVCNKNFSQRQYLNIHWRTVHCGEKRFSCEQCGLKFTRNSSLKQHQKSVHEQEKPFYCFECDYKCARSSHLKQHYRNVHSKPSPVEMDEPTPAFSGELESSQ